MIRIAVAVVALAAVVYTQSGDEPPSIWEPTNNRWPERMVYVRQNDNRTFHCQADGRPKPMYEWFKDGIKVSNVEDVIQVGKNSGSLTALKYFDKRNSGYYQCKATNTKGSSMTPPIKISATVAQTFRASEGDSTKEVKVLTSYYLLVECEDIPESIPPYKISWERGKVDSITGDLKTAKVEMDNRMVMDPKGHLHFLWVEMSDNDYVYVCKAENVVIKIEMTNTKQVKLKVSDPADIHDRAPDLKYHANVEVLAGDDATLTCIFTYFSKEGESLDITWYLRGDVVGKGTTLTLPNVQLPTDKVNLEGTYMCEAKLGQKIARQQLELKIVAPPQFQPGKEPISYSVPLEKDAMLRCNTTSHNSYSNPPMWMVNGDPIVGCPLGHFECAERKTNGYSICIPLSERCDNTPDCDPKNSMSSDEQNCPKTVTCTESGLKACGDKCIPVADECLPHVCNYPQFLCSDKITCIGEKKLCDGVKDCGDGADENLCPGRDSVEAGRFRISSDRALLTLPNVKLADTMCFQCSVSNNYGVAFGDACLSIIDKIEVSVKPNESYLVEPGTYLNIGVDATTDVMWQSQMKYEWFWYREVTDPNTDQKYIEKTKLPPSDKFAAYFSLSQTGKNLTITITEVENDDRNAYDIYTAMTENGQIYAIKIGHQYDSFEMNFTITGTEIVAPEPVPIVVTTASQNLWIIALVLGIIVLFIVVIIIVCYMYRNRGGTYLLGKKEHQAGHDPEKELKDSGFHDVSRVDDDYDDEKPRPDEVSLSESVKPYESDEDMAEEYATDLSKFNEDGSFIGQYGDKKSKPSSGPREATV